MKILLDTSAFLKWVFNERGLKPRQKEILSDEKNHIYFSRVSAWEILIKSGIGKLQLKKDPGAFIETEMEYYGFLDLPIELNHIFRLNGFPAHHRDPFDRLLIAQALVEGLPILTVDKIFNKYKVKTI